MATLAEDDPSDDSEDDDDDETDGFAALQSAWISNDDLDDCMSRARDASTTKGYKSAVKKFLAFCVLFMATQVVCSDVLKLNDDDSGNYVFDVPKLAKSMESVHGPYFQYTRQYQQRLQEKGKSGIGGIKQLRSGLTDLFCSASVELSNLALKVLTLWQKSRNRDDMTAKMRSVNPVKFTNARDSIPVDAYETIAKSMAFKNNVQLWVMFLLQWNMISRISQVTHVMFNFMSWKQDHFVAKHGSSKKDKKASRAFPMAIMANRYCWYLCPVLAIAMWMSITSFPEGGNKLFPGSTQDATYTTWLRDFFTNNAISLAEWAHLLLGSHSVRKGATNAAGQGGLVADVLMPVLIRGLWDIGDTLTRYFKELTASDSLVARLLAGHVPNSPKFRALHPHFMTTSESQRRLINTATINQFDSRNPLWVGEDASKRLALTNMLASLVHHYESLDRDLPEDHPLRSTWIFRTTDPKRNALKNLLGPEFETSVAGKFDITTGIPPVVELMVQNQKDKEEALERERIKEERNLERMDRMEDVVTQVAAQQKKLQNDMDEIKLKGLTTVGPEALKQMINNGLSETESATVASIGQLKEVLMEIRSTMTAANPATTTAANAAVVPGVGGDAATLNTTQNNAVAQLVGPMTADTMSTIDNHDPKLYLWAHTDTDLKRKDKEMRLRQLPNAFKFARSKHNTLALSNVYATFTAQSGTASRPIPALNSIRNPTRAFSNKIERGKFSKAKSVVKVMNALLDANEEGRTLKSIFQANKTHENLKKLSHEAGQRILKHMPPSKKRVRSKPDSLCSTTIFGHLKKIKLASKVLQPPVANGVQSSV